MNLYLVLAIALGALSSVVDAPVLRPVQLVAQQDCRRQQRQVRIAFAVRTPAPARIRSWRPRCESRAPRAYGHGTPRAPAAV